MKFQTDGKMKKCFKPPTRYDVASILPTFWTDAHLAIHFFLDVWPVLMPKEGKKNSRTWGYLLTDISQSNSIVMNWRTATEGCIYHYPILGGSSYKYGQLYTSYKSVISHNWRMNGLWFMNVCDSIYGLWFRNGLWCTVCKSVIYNSIYGLWMFMTFPFNPQPYRNHWSISGFNCSGSFQR